jgi:acyl transferase domain-containing protein
VSRSTGTDRRLNRSPVAIVGVACALPNAPDVRAYWQNMLDAPEDADDVTAAGAARTPAPVVADDLLRDAGATGSDWYDPSRTGVVLGLVGPPPDPAGDLSGDTAGDMAGDMARHLGLGGSSRAVDTAGTTSLTALQEAVAELVDGRATMMIYGGGDAAARPRDGEPPGDAAAGPRFGGGISLLALRLLSAAERDGNRVYAVIHDIDSSGGGRGMDSSAALAETLIRLALSLYHGIAPATIIPAPSSASTSPAGATSDAAARTLPWLRAPQQPVRRAAASATDGGGPRVHVVLQQYGPDRRPVRTLHRTARAYLWHAPDTDGLLELLRAGAPPHDARHIPDDAARVGFVAADPGSAEGLRALAARLLAQRRDADHWSHPARVFFRRRARPGLAVGALFAGQGSQYLDMGLDAALNIPTVASALDDANAAFASDGERLARVIYPPPAVDAGQRQEQEDALRRTEYAQPAIGALSAGHFRYLTELGLRCAGFLGHSFGELTALWAAGALDDADFFRLARARGAATMPPAGAAARDPGTMAAIEAAREQVFAVLAGFPDVVICNHNAPDQVVVGGPTRAVGEVVRECERRGLDARPLKVAAAFHTGHVAHAVEAFRPAVDAADIRSPVGRVYANTAGARYRSDPEHNRRVLTTQLLQPVEFVQALRAMRADGCTVFVEFGPKQILSGLVRRTLPASEVVAIACDPGPLGDSDVALKLAALQLAVLGAPLVGINRYDGSARTEASPAGLSVAG